MALAACSVECIVVVGPSVLGGKLEFGDQPLRGLKMAIPACLPERIVVVGPRILGGEGESRFAGEPLSDRLIDEQQISALQRQGKTVNALACDGVLLGYVAFADQLRASSRTAVAQLAAMGIRVVMLSGDNQATAQAIAVQAGIAEFRADVKPQDKAAQVQSFKQAPSLKRGGREGVVGMVGDGINDAPALAAADVSFAMRSGSDIAIEAADITLMRNDLMSVVDAISLSRATLTKIRQNLFFAFAYNVLGIPLAILGMLSPVIAGAAMAMSSVSVVSNALLLKRWRPAQPGISSD